MFGLQTDWKYVSAVCECESRIRGLNSAAPRHAGKRGGISLSNSTIPLVNPAPSPEQFTRWIFNNFKCVFAVAIHGRFHTAIDLSLRTRDKTSNILSRCIAKYANSGSRESIRLYLEPILLRDKVAVQYISERKVQCSKTKQTEAPQLTNPGI